MRIDAHQHFWLYNEVKDAWITDDMVVLKRNFLPNDISETLKRNGFDGAIAVQADQSHRETAFLVELSEYFKLIKGVVGWVDLRAERIEEHLEHFSKFPIIKGFRHIIEAEPEGDFLIREDFQRGLAALTKYNYTFDLLIRPRHYASTLLCVLNNPQQKFMLDHIAKPAIKTKEFDDWALFIEQLSKYPNVYCKISGLATEAEWKTWKLDHFSQYIDHVILSFGKDRVCFGSDWPVCELAATYEESIQIVEQKLDSFTAEEAEGFWGGVATKFYGLK
ncbi:amidohydrolase family protein [Sphingobacterium rhinopitheci]|uniref:amidohydrolase family protein n=1 Tax=Sphingobacterium rhinopitheci TaxID=2781960 RepID=UPI001F51DD9A|nr:amidohydrolase family protein [Sphingobacterium rhinopitheci]MCI0922003.1 amidohydrolase family protein [Sphingobacterium rhinopitheci]